MADELGGCGRPYATPCAREHACLRSPSLQVHPTMLFRLDDLERDLKRRREQAGRERCLGELEGMDLALEHLRGKRASPGRLAARRDEALEDP
ncbi:hypothetical protein [Pseudonocardia xishanensis]|uniref:hypothetical protein n=1 Tax=Pseudonocardia xishanensis TaxID=630995 RepID=UPI0031E5BD08